MGGESKQAWNEVEDRFSAWGRKVAERYRETERSGTDTAKEAQHKLEEAAKDVVDQLGRAFTAVGDTLKDDAAKEQLKAAFSALGTAIGSTVSEAGEAIRGKTSTTSDDAPRPDVPPADATPAPEPPSPQPPAGEADAQA